MSTRIYAPRHRRCVRRSHHAWTYTHPIGGAGWRIARCANCGKEELA